MAYKVFSINLWGSQFDNSGLDGDADDGQGVGKGCDANKPENAGQPAQRIDVGAGDDMASRFDAHLVADPGFDPSYVDGLTPSFVWCPRDGDISTRGVH